MNHSNEVSKVIIINTDFSVHVSVQKWKVQAEMNDITDMAIQGGDPGKVHNNSRSANTGWLGSHTSAEARKCMHALCCSTVISPIKWQKFDIYIVFTSNSSFHKNTLLQSKRSACALMEITSD